MTRSPYSDLTLYKRLLNLARPYWVHIFGIFLLNLLSTPLSLLAPLPLKIAVDSVVGSQPLPEPLQVLLPSEAISSGVSVLLLTAGMVVGVALLSQLQRLSNWMLVTYAGEKLVLAFRAQLFRHGQRLSLAHHDSKGTADSIYRIQYDAPSIQWIAIDGIIPFISVGFTLVAMIWVTMQLDWQLALVALTVAPALFGLTQLFRPRLRRDWREVKDLQSSAMSVVQEVLTAIRVVKAFGQEDREHERFLRYSQQSVWAHIRVVFTEGAFNLLIGLATAIGTAAVLYVGITHVQSGLLTLGELLLVMSYLAQIYEPLRMIGQRVASLQGSLASAERALTLLDETPDVLEHPNPRRLKRARGEIEFRRLTFSYSTEPPVLWDVSVHIPAGTRAGIVGATGAGKTTLMSLLARFYDPTGGEILLDGYNLKDYKLADLRNQFGIVPQDPVLLSNSIAENIAYARPEAGLQDIILAATAANADGFIQRLPQGYDTVVGERGMRLSGGERQRIALARAFLKDAPVLILDEPTSSVDIYTEAVIMEAMLRLMEGRTTFLVAHRLATLQHSDLLLILEQGRLVAATDQVSETILRATTHGAWWRPSDVSDAAIRSQTVTR